MGWVLLVLLYLLLFSAKVPEVDAMEKRADWYVIGTNIFKGLA